MGLIYKATNSITGKSYIGQTKLTLDNRKNSHRACFHKYDNYFSRMIKKYGFEILEWSILENNLDSTHMVKVSKGNLHHHKNYKCTKLEGGDCHR
jgi:hypothetical protein